MKKIKYLLLVFVLAVLVTGCTGGSKEDSKKAEVEGTIGQFSFTLKVPNTKYELTTTKPEYAKKTGSYYLVTDKTTFVFSTTTWTYQTSYYYKEEYGTKDPSFEDYLKWKDNSKSGIRLAGDEKLKLNDRSAMRYQLREGGSGDYDYYGYMYLVSLDDINPKMRFDVAIYYNEKELPKESVELDKVTLDVLNTLTITKAK